MQALKDVALTIPASMYGLPGPNVGGKSTLMRMIATLQEPDGGRIRLGGFDVLLQSSAWFGLIICAVLNHLHRHRKTACL